MTPPLLLRSFRQPFEIAPGLARTGFANLKRMRSLVAFAMCIASCEGSIVWGRSAAPTREPSVSPSSMPMGGPAESPHTLTDGAPSFVDSARFELRRLTSEQYRLSVESVLGLRVLSLPPIEPVSPVGGLSALGASTAVLSSGGVGQFESFVPR